MSLASISQVLKLIGLIMFAISNVSYIGQFIHSFRAYEQLAHQVEESGAASNNNDLNAVRFVLRILVDYKKHLWMIAFTMFVSFATSALLLIQLEYGKSQMQAKRVVCVVDVLTVIVLSYLFTARFYITENLELHLQEALEGSNRLTDTNEFNNELNCSIVPRENLRSCAHVILSKGGLARTLEYVVLPCWFVVPYILVSYPIQYCLHHCSSKARRNRSVTDDIHTQHTQSMALSSVYEP